MRTAKSLSLVILMLMSTLVLLIPAAPSVMATNETQQGVITGTETWSGTHSLTGDVRVAAGAQLVINAGTTINLPNGSFVDVEGAICAGAATCGATPASTGSPIRFIWADPVNDSMWGRCGTNPDAKCGEGLILRNTVDTSITKLSHVEFNNGYGYPILAQGQQNPYYGVLVFDGSSIAADNLKFDEINTSNVLSVNLAAPIISDSTFVVGTDGQGWDASAIRAYSSGTGILSTFTIRDSVFTGAQADNCGNQGGGRSALYAEDSYVELDTITISDNAYGVFMAATSGAIKGSTFQTQCNAIDTNGHKATGDIKHWLSIENNTITTADGAGLTAYDTARVNVHQNVISGAAEGSGVGIRGATVVMTENTIGPIAGWNGLWVYGDDFDVIAENNTILNVTKEPLLVGEYHYLDNGWNVPQPTRGRIYFANNSIEGVSGTCQSDEMYGGEFPCPAMHIFMSSATLNDNTVISNIGDGIRATGAIINAQRNNVEVGEFAVRASMMDDHYGNKYATLGYFAENTWTGASQIYNITESSITVQSEYIPDPDPASGEIYPVSLSWGGAECPWVADECLQMPFTKDRPPRGMPLGMEIINNASIFMFANLTNFDLSKAHIQNQNTAWGVQLQQGELVRLRTMVKGVHVSGADVVIRDAIGREVYNMTTDPWGYTPWVSLPSNFHIDTNWNHLANDPGEDSCNDGIDNDGDSLFDQEDEDCQGAGRERSSYHITASRFGKGSLDYTMNLLSQIDDVITLNNINPSMNVDQPDGTSFKRVVTISGAGWDGISGPYFNDYDAWTSQFGIIKQIQVKPPGVADWDDAYIAVDTSNADGEITRDNHPWRTWSFEWDMGEQAEDDYTFEFRAFDGLDFSPGITRIFKLNTVAPTIFVDGPANHSAHDNVKVTFTGRASDPYSGVQGNDIKLIHFEIHGPNDYFVTTTTTGGPTWAYDWDFSALNSGEYTFRIWASDSDFCKDSWGECTWRELVLDIENENARPIIELSDPLPDISGRISASENTVISGVAKDNDGQVTKIEITVEDLQTGLPLQNVPGPITNFQQVGVWQAWSIDWDTRSLTHDFQYKLVVRAYDGYDWSFPSELTFIIDNPPDADNLRPVFNTTGWDENIQLFCDSDSQSYDRCTVGEINLHDYFYDPDGILTGLNFLVVNNPNDPTDDDFDDLIRIDTKGIARYNPVDALDIIGADVGDWTLNGVQFEVIDSAGSRNSSFLVNFVVQSIDFTVKRVDSSGNDPVDMDVAITDDDPAFFSGRGRPGSVVYIRLIDGNREVNHTAVGTDGFWHMEVTESQLAGEGLTAIKFEYNGQSIAHNVQAGEEESGSLGTVLWIAIGVGLVVALLGLFVFFFVEIEDEEDEMDSEMAEEEEKDPYAWARNTVTEEVQQSAVAAAQQAAPAPQPTANPEYPGWLWDPGTNQWVPDPNYVHESQ